MCDLSCLKGQNLMSVHCCAMLCIPVSGHHQLVVSILKAEDGAYRFVRNLGAEGAESGVLYRSTALQGGVAHNTAVCPLHMNCI